MRRTKHTVRISTDFADCVNMEEPPITVEFYTAGEFVQARSYQFNEEEMVGRRVLEWLATGKLSNPYDPSAKYHLTAN